MHILVFKYMKQTDRIQEINNKTISVEDLCTTPSAMDRTSKTGNRETE